MSRRTTKHSLEQRLEAVNKALSGNYSLVKLARQYKIDKTTLIRWCQHYQNNGIDGLKESHTWRSYSKELKYQAVFDYLDNHLSLAKCCQKYNISSREVLRNWIRKYTSGKALTNIHGGTTRMKAKKTTLEERLKIVHFTLTHDKDYRAAVEKYQVSYSQVYNWVKKYEQKGRNGLIDNRGRQLKDRQPEVLTHEEKLQKQIDELKARNKDLEIENHFLKKLRALRKSKQ